ncbi:acyltransferase [Robbsia sp. Bb-Pol-6]|uniref:Acyltransferase n=1 Tax=Robbsia betulipollinis TaxID=2981849 RepID=A0ABT3ZM70_9BURK|nr:acyltransferase [Robbsia betulipollinis]MCY0387651.1 acyltransferase [Robbsia betulipollinis]
MKRIASLDGLRGWAVAMVFIGHAERTVPGGYSGILTPLKWFSAGDLGVHLFFVLSGFIITRLLLGEFAKTGRIDLANFYLRRTRRIFPAFYIYLIIIGTVGAIGYLSIDSRQMLVATFYLWNYAGILGLDSLSKASPDGIWYLGHFWTLSLEEQFYWFWPALFIFMMKFRRTWVLTALIVIVPSIRIVSYFMFPAVRGQLNTMFHTGIDSILVGCLFAIHQERAKILFSKILDSKAALTCLTLVIFFLFPICHHYLRGYWTATYLRTFEAATIGVFILALAIGKDFFLRSVFLCRPVLFLGTISYSLYLWQQLFNGLNEGMAFGFPLSIAETLGAASLSFYLIEKRFNARRPHAIEPSAMR